MVALIFAAMVFETLGIGLIIPIANLIMDEHFLTAYPVLTPWLTRFGLVTQSKLAVASMSFLAGAFILKSIFLAIVLWYESTFIFDIRAALSRRLFKNYLHQDYAFHLQKNSAQVINHLTGEVGQFGRVLRAVIDLLAECSVVFGIGLLLIAAEPVGALLIIAVFGFTTWLYQMVTKRHVLRWGRDRQKHEGLKIQQIQQGIGALKDLIVSGKQSAFLSEFDVHNRRSARVAHLQMFSSRFPRLWLELLSILGMAAVVIIKVREGQLMAIVPILGLFGAAAFRLLPSVNKIIAALQVIKFGVPTIDKLYDEAVILDENLAKAAQKVKSTGKVDFQKQIKLDHVYYIYPGTTTRVLTDLCFDINRGESIAIVGGSGAGKSTIVDVVLGILQPTSGTVSIDGVDIQTNLDGWRHQLGYVPQFIFLTDDTLTRNIAFGIPDKDIDMNALHSALKMAQLSEFVKELPEGLQTKVGERGVRLSGGQRQRIGIARALYHNPQFLVLDEATSALDNETEKEVMRAVKALKGKKTTLIVAHRLSTIEHCDKVLQIEKGKLKSEKINKPMATPAEHTIAP
jgi:ABC-type multidrug transport system fused ATPase/permease subunit